MLLKKSFILLFIIGCAFCSFAQTAAITTQPRILILLDRSSSMTLPWEGNRVKTKVADELILRIMDSVYKVNKDVEFSLRVFGHQSLVADNDCHDTRNEVPFSKDNRLQMEYRLEDIKPLGVTSIAYALEQAADHDLVDISRNAYSIILITDGGESCGGDICAVMEKLARSKVFFRPYIVNLESSAVVRSSYSCMGDYLEVTRGGDIPVAVSKIVKAFRPVINMTTKEYTEVKEIAAKAPTVMNVTIPTVKIIDTAKVVVPPPPPPLPPPVPKRKPDAISSLQVATFNGLKVMTPTPMIVRPTPAYIYVPVITEDEPEQRPVVALSGIAPAAVRSVKLPAPALPRTRATSVLPLVPVIRDEPVERPAPVTMAKLVIDAHPEVRPTTPPTLPKPRTTRSLEYEPAIREELPAPVQMTKLTASPPRRIMTFILLENGSVIQYRRNIPPIPAPKFDAPPPPPPVVKKPVAKTPVGTKIPDDKIAEYTIENEDAEETTVEIYLTNGNGKFYVATPQVFLLDPVTDKQIKRFYRTVDADGNPDPRTDILPGTYKMAFSETRSLIAQDVVIEKNKKNKIVIKVKKASLSFQYEGDAKRPVKEFEAVVIERNKVDGGAIVRQKCTERLEFEPGNYHVEINTFPMDRRNIDLDFDERVIIILQPGFAKFTGEDGMTSVTLYQRLAEKYMSFSTVKLTDPVSQHLEIQPGEYQAHYHKGPGGQFGSEKVVPFIIKSKEVTEVILK